MIERVELYKRELPKEVAALYGPYLDWTTFLNDCRPVEGSINFNQRQTAEEILALIGESQSAKEGVTIGLLGTMGAGKTTTICLLAEDLEGFDVAVYKHRLDSVRTGERLTTHIGDLSIEAGLYESLDDLDDETQIIFIDEFQFNSKDNPDEIRDFLSRRKLKGKQTVISQLDFDFRRRPWRTTEILLPLSDVILALQARCEDCGAPAYFPQRNIDGQPAHINDPLVMVGAEELYQPKCGRCHQVRGKLLNDQF
ncbi:MAG TPA: hypothetical protein VMX76_03695 [Nevskiaceae bacterium]|nr:hypothetical protein [Nevskiaceae bacterium]